MSFDEPVATEIDGVRVWYTDVPGPCQGGIVFRTGKADETLANSGITHVVEHLTLFPLMDAGYDMNGFVSVLTTAFHVNGTQAQTEAFLSSVCASLRSPPLERLDDERSVLETEARSRGSSFAGSASARYGARGFGLVDWFEFGLRHLGADDVAAWAAERFTTGQAAVWLTRPPSPDLDLRLPPGDRLPIPVPEPIPGLVLPSHLHGWQQHIGCSLVAPRSMPLLIATTILRERAMEKLRRDRALTYSVGRSEERIGAKESMQVVVLDSTSRHMADAIQVFTRLLEEIAGGEITDAQVRAAVRRAMPWNATDPERPAREAFRKANACLFGREPTTWTALKSQGERMKPARVARALDEALNTAILVAPEGFSVPERYAGHPEPPPRRPVMGRLFVRWDGNRGDEVILSDRGVTRRTGAEARTILFDETEVAAQGPDGTLDVIDRAGNVVSLDPNQLMGGKILAEEITGRLGARVVDLRHDAIGWFELQSLVESHDTTAVEGVWREIERLAQLREAGERILLIAFASYERRKGLLAVTDRRVVHLTMKPPPRESVFPRSMIVSAEALAGVTGRRVKIVLTDGGATTFDRIRPRAQAAQLALLLWPLPEG